MKRYIEIIKKCQLFNNISHEDILPMMKCLDGKIYNYSKDETIISEGDEAKYVGIVLSGSVQIIRMDYYGNKSIVASIVPSEIFGESFACANVREIPINAVAAENTTVLMVDCKKIIYSCINTCRFHNTLIFNLMKILATKNILFNQKAEITSKRTTREKLMTFLTLQAKKYRKNDFEITFDRQELADYLEVDRSGLSAEISKLRNEGVIECKRNFFKLL